MKNNIHILTLDEVISIISNWNSITLEDIERETYLVDSLSNTFGSTLNTGLGAIFTGYTGARHHFTAKTSPYGMTNNAMDICNMIGYQNGGKYCVIVKSSDITIDKLKLGVKDFLTKLVSILDLCYQRYDTLLSLYNTETSNLIKKLETTTSSTINTSGTTASSTTDSSESVGRNQDTPITSLQAQFQDTYNSSRNKTNTTGSSSSAGNNQQATSSSTTIQADRDLLINEIDEVQAKYRNLLLEACNEFKGLFWEVENYE